MSSSGRLLKIQKLFIILTILKENFFSRPKSTVWQQIKFKIYRQVEGATCQCQTGACDLPAFSTKYSSVCTCTARLTYLESRHTKEEGKCLSASEHHRITPSYTDSTSELPLLSFVFSSIFFLSFKVSYTHWKAILLGLCWQEDFFNQNVAKLFCNNVPAAATNIFQKRMMAPQVENYIDKRVLSTQEFIQKKNIPIFAIEVWVIMGILV